MSETPAPRPAPGQLTFAAPRRGKPPRHLADLDAGRAQGRRRARSGRPGFRAKQLSTHYFARLVDDPEEMTDLPGRSRDELVGALLPTLLTPLRTLEADEGTTRKTLWRLLRRRAGRVGADALPRPGHDVRLQPGRLRHGLPVLRHRPGRADRATCPPPRSSSRSSPAPGRCARGEVPGGAGPRLRVSNVVFMGMGEPLANYKAVIGAVRRLTDPAPDGLGMSARGITVSTVGLVPADRPARRRGHPGHAGAVAARPRRRAAQRAGADQHPLEGRRGVDAARRYYDGDRAPGLDRVRPDPRHQRPGLARRPARRRAQPARRLGLGARQPDPAQPDPRLEVDRLATRRTSASSSGGCEAHGIPTTVRDTRGREIDGACGQLAAADGLSGLP